MSGATSSACSDTELKQRLAALLKSLGVNSVEELRSDKDAQRRLLRHLAGLPPAEFGQLLNLIPALSQTITEIILSAEKLGDSIEETKRIRWQTLADMAKAGALKDGDLLEAIKILADLDAKQPNPMPWVHKLAVVFVGVSLGVLISVLLRTPVQPRK